MFMKVNSLVKFLAILLIYISFSSFTKGKSTESLKQTVIAEVGDEKINYDELERAFQKNMNKADSELKTVPIDSIINFLDLYTKYRLKVLDAFDRGFHKDSTVIADIKQNRKILAETYYYEKKLMNPWVQKMVKYRNNEYKIAVMVFAFPPSQEPDTTTAYRKAMNSLKLLKDGEKFEKVAMDSSDDPETSKFGGEVKTWITAGNVQRPLEKIILNLKEGEYHPELIRTRYGYFILKLIDKEPRKFVKSKHILFTYGEEDSTKVEKTAKKVLKELKDGADFGELAKKYSDDKQTAKNGGVLDGWYSRSTGFEKNNRRLVPEYEDALFSLKDGEFSDLVPSIYGYHIIFRDSSKEIDIENEIKDLKSIYRKSYYEQDKKDFLDSLYKAYNFKIQDDVLNDFIEHLDSSKTNLQENWYGAIPTDMYSEILYELLGNSTSVGEFIKEMQTDIELRGTGLNRKGILKAIDKQISPLIINEATKYLEEEYPEFSRLMKEFRDGILLFKAEQIEVWDKLKFDSTLAKKYWDTTKTHYRTEPAYDISEIYVLSDSIANEIYQKLQNGAEFEELAKEHTQRKGFRENKGNWEKIKKDHALVKLLIENDIKEGKISEPIEFEKGYSIIKFNQFYPSRQKTFEEAISDFAPKFQDLMQKHYLESWLKKIQERFPIKIYKQKILKINEQLRNNG